jgi:hypothetical protein
MPRPLLAPVYDAATVIARLEDAGMTLLCLPGAHMSARLTSSVYILAGDARKQVHPTPAAAAIDAMDEALGWIGLIPQDRYVLRRIVGARALVNPLTGKHLFPWRRLGTALGADHKAVQRWHVQGINLIVAALGQQQAA